MRAVSSGFDPVGDTRNSRHASTNSDLSQYHRPNSVAESSRENAGRSTKARDRPRSWRDPIEFLVDASELRLCATRDAERGGAQQSTETAVSRGRRNKQPKRKHESGCRERKNRRDACARDESPDSNAARRHRREGLATLAAREQPSEEASGDTAEK